MTSTRNVWWPETDVRRDSEQSLWEIVLNLCSICLAPGTTEGQDLEMFLVRISRACRFTDNVDLDAGVIDSILQKPEKNAVRNLCENTQWRQYGA